MNRNGPFLILGILLVAVIVVVIVLGIQTSNKINANNNSIADLQTQNTSLRNSLTNLNSQITTLNDQVAQAKSELTQANTQVTALSNQVTTDSSQVNTLKTQLTTATTDVASLKTKVTTLETQVATLTTKASSLQTQIDNLDSSSSAYQYDTLVSSDDFTVVSEDYEILYSNLDTNSGDNGYIKITGTLDPSDFEDLYVIVRYEGDTAMTSVAVSSYDNIGESFDSGMEIDIDENEDNVKIYLANAGLEDVDANNVTVRYYYQN